MRLFPLVCDYWKMDGGVAFGTIPHSIWSRIYPPDENNMIEIVTRCLLIENYNELILIDTGMGNKRDPKYYSYKYRKPECGLKPLLEKLGFSPDDITKVIFTHLHDDHCGAAIENTENGFQSVFPSAAYYCSEQQFQWALNPSSRDSAAYFTDNFLPIYEKGLLHFVDEGVFNDAVSFRVMHGHTRGQLIPFIKTSEQTYVFCADFIPSYGHISIPYIPSVDMQPLISMKEKEVFLEEACQKNMTLIFQHDSIHEASKVEKTRKGYRGGGLLRLSD